MTVKIVSWNIAGMIAPWHSLITMDADVALLQEAAAPPHQVAKRIGVDPAVWYTAGWPGWQARTAIANLSQRAEVEWITAKPVGQADSGELGVSRLGTLTAARVKADGVEPFIAVSMYSFWENPHSSVRGSWIVPDASAHRLISDLSVFIGSQDGHRVVAAGDLNVLYGHGDNGNEYWAGRYGSVFERMEALGMPFVGPQAPQGRQAYPWPEELPCESRNVPTYRPRKDPVSATRQLDFVFASQSMADSVSVRAINELHEWGPSDHCRLEIVVS